MEKNREVSKYYAAAPERFRTALEEIRKNIFEILADEAEMSENFSYQIAVYKYGKKPLFSVAYFKNHCSLITQDKDIADKISELNNYKISGTSVHFTEKQPISRKLLEKVLKLRIQSRLSE
jgi:uncharacterized protein YdhG (YjbR/CyaY superfamily)